MFFRSRSLLGVGALGSLAAATQVRYSSKPGPQHCILASSSRSALLPTTVLVHGLDSSKETFAGTLSGLVNEGYPCISLDLRGHGESPLGDEDDFSAATLAGDVLCAIRAHGIERAVLVGHSMGGRVAMRAAALDATSSDPVLRAVVIEDMDLKARYASPPLSSACRSELARFSEEDGRRFATWDAARASLMRWYDGDSARINSWRGKRVRPLPDGSWWSDINPVAQRLACDRVLASNDGSDAWDALATCGEDLPFAVHVWYADELDQPGGTVVDLHGAGGIEDMKRRLPAATFTFFAGAGHSIHRTRKAQFDKHLRDVIGKAATR